MTVTTTPAAARPTVDVWSDIMCPLCYIGDTLLEQAIADSAHRSRRRMVCRVALGIRPT